MTVAGVGLACGSTALAQDASPNIEIPAEAKRAGAQIPIPAEEVFFSTVVLSEDWKDVQRRKQLVFDYLGARRSDFTAESLLACVRASRESINSVRCEASVVQYSEKAGFKKFNCEVAWSPTASASIRKYVDSKGTPTETRTIKTPSGIWKVDLRWIKSSLQADLMDGSASDIFVTSNPIIQSMMLPSASFLPEAWLPYDLLALAQHGSLVIVCDKISVAGKTCMAVDVGTPVVWRCFLSLDDGLLPIRFESFSYEQASDGTISGRTLNYCRQTLEVGETSSGVPYPKSTVRVWLSRSADGSIGVRSWELCTTTRFVVNESVDDASLLEIPSGTIIRDSRRSLTYKSGGDGLNREVSESIAHAAATARETFSNRSSAPGVGSLVVGIAMTIVGALLAWKSRWPNFFQR